MSSRVQSSRVPSLLALYHQASLQLSSQEGGQRCHAHSSFAAPLGFLIRRDVTACGTGLRFVSCYPSLQEASGGHGRAQPQPAGLGFAVAPTLRAQPQNGENSALSAHSGHGTGSELQQHLPSRPVPSRPPGSASQGKEPSQHPSTWGGQVGAQL